LAREDRPDPNPEDLPERITVEPTPPRITGETPAELLSAIIADLSDRIGVAPEQEVASKTASLVATRRFMGSPFPSMMHPSNSEIQ
jgi:hypothetical protein